MSAHQAVVPLCESPIPAQESDHQGSLSIISDGPATTRNKAMISATPIAFSRLHLEGEKATKRIR